MAIQLPVTFGTGLDAQQCYAKITDCNTHISGNESCVRIMVQYYLDITSRQAGKNPIEIEWFTITAKVPDPDTGELISNPAYSQFFSLASLEVEGNNPVKKAYQYLRALAKFEAGTDV